MENKNREQGVEGWYEYQLKISEIDLSQLRLWEYLGANDNCIHCGEPMKYDDGTELRKPRNDLLNWLTITVP